MARLLMATQGGWGRGAPFAAVGTGTSDDAPAFQAAHDALPATGGWILVPEGLYQMNSGLTFTKAVRFIGSGASVQSGATPTVLRFAAGVSGITLDTAGQFSSISDMMLLSQSTGAGAGKGLTIKAHGATAERVVIKSFGSHGVYLDTVASGNANGAKLLKVRCDGNFGDGFNVPTGAQNSNTLSVDKCESSNNGGWGYFNDGNANTFLGCECENNTLGAYKDTGSGSVYLGCYAEGDAHNNADFSGATLGEWIGGSFGTPVFTPAPAGSFRVERGGHFDKFMRIGNDIDAGSQKEWQLSSGSYATGTLALTNQTDGTNVFNINGPTTRFQFNVPVDFVPRTAASAPNSSLFVDSADNKLKWKDSGGVVNLLY